MSRSLEERMARLEAMEDIRQLKHRYLAACDGKDPQAMRACFADGPVHIDYGPVGVFDHADAVVQVFKDLGCHPHILEMHHGCNDSIELIDADHAKAHWALFYQQINTQTQTLTQLGSTYEDEYVRTPEGWKISRTVSVPRSVLVLNLADEGVQALVRGVPPQAPQA